MRRRLLSFLLIYLLLPAVSADEAGLSIYLAKEAKMGGEIAWGGKRFSLRGCDVKDGECMPWLSAFPLYGEYRVAEISSDGEVRLVAKSGRVKMLQNIRGVNGLLLLPAKGASGLWRHNGKKHLDTFGRLSLRRPLPEKIFKKLKPGDAVKISPLVPLKIAKKSIVGKDFDYTLWRENGKWHYLPEQKHFCFSRDLDLEILDSVDFQIVSAKLRIDDKEREALEKSFAPAVLFHLPLLRVEVEVYRLTPNGRDLLFKQETNSNIPYIFQQTLEGKKRISRDDTALLIWRQFYLMPNAQNCSIKQARRALGKLREQLGNTFSLDDLQRETRKILPGPYLPACFNDWTLCHCLVPIIVSGRICWQWRKEMPSFNSKLSWQYYPIIRLATFLENPHGKDPY